MKRGRPQSAERGRVERAIREYPFDEIEAREIIRRSNLGNAGRWRMRHMFGLDGPSRKKREAPTREVAPADSSASEKRSGGRPISKKVQRRIRVRYLRHLAEIAGASIRRVKEGQNRERRRRLANGGQLTVDDARELHESGDLYRVLMRRLRGTTRPEDL